jgi:hypothetical protein
VDMLVFMAVHCAVVAVFVVMMMFVFMAM